MHHAHSWQERIFRYIWNRIYTTNIDNVLTVAWRSALKSGRTNAQFEFFNYTDAGILGHAIGCVPVVSIHGAVEKLADGFIFSNHEYGKAAANKILDWHNELAARILVGGLVVIGNQLDESDIDTYLAARIKEYGPAKDKGRNWIVMPGPDFIKKANYIDAGYDVIDATAEQFFEVVFSKLKPKSIEEILQDEMPLLKKHHTNGKAMVWFKEAFNPVLSEVEDANAEAGILRHFVTGAHPSWFFIQNQAHATTSKIAEITTCIATLMNESKSSFGILHAIGPSGSGKTTAIRASLAALVKTYPYIYEYDSENGIDIEYLTAILNNFSNKSILVFYSASDFYYAINALALKLKDSARPYVLFILEDRTNDFKKNKRHLPDCAAFSSEFEFGSLNYEDAKKIATKIESYGMQYPDFSEHSLEKRAKKILSVEKGYGGDLLSTLFSLTTNENFEKKIYQEYHRVKTGPAQDILDVVAIMNAFGLPIPLNYLSGFLNLEIKRLAVYLDEDLSGIVTASLPKMHIACRHRVIANCYVNMCIAGKGTVDFIVTILEYLSRQFTVEDIRFHPLPYEIYKKIISVDFLFGSYFPLGTRTKDAERTYHEAQRFFGKDGVFWLHFGKFYRKIGQIDDAIDCFRTGLEFYDSFQTRHSLGMALLEKYIKNDCNDHQLYDEGILILEVEQVRRGPTDPYPTTTLCNLLFQIFKHDRSNEVVGTKFKEHVNNGLKNFKEDPYFQRIISEYYALR